MENVKQIKFFCLPLTPSFISKQLGSGWDAEELGVSSISKLFDTQTTAFNQLWKLKEMRNIADNNLFGRLRVNELNNLWLVCSRKKTSYFALGFPFWKLRVYKPLTTWEVEFPKHHWPNWQRNVHVYKLYSKFQVQNNTKLSLWTLDVTLSLPNKLSSASIFKMLQCRPKLVKIRSECQTAWIWLRRRVTRHLIRIQAVC